MHNNWNAARLLQGKRIEDKEKNHNKIFSVLKIRNEEFRHQLLHIGGEIVGGPGQLLNIHEAQIFMRLIWVLANESRRYI